mgnify:CR=1 FL=1
MLKDSILLDADKIAKEIYSEDKKVLHDLLRCFGKEIFYTDGTIDYKVLANKVFSSRAELKKLNNLMFGPIEEKVRNLVKRNKDKKYIIIDAAVLFDAGLYKLCDFIIFVKADKKRQKDFLKMKFSVLGSLSESMDNLKENEINLRIKGQSIRINEKLIDFVIDNKGSKIDLYKQAERILQKLGEKNKRFFR